MSNIDKIKELYLYRVKKRVKPNPPAKKQTASKPNLAPKISKPSPSDTRTFKKLSVTPFPFQIEGADLIDKFNGRALLADDMGLGKTIQALLWLQRHPEIRPAIIVCPAFLKINWLREARKWVEVPNVQIISGKVPKPPAEIYLGRGIIIINYEILSNSFTKILDEETGKTRLKEKNYTGWVDYLKEVNPKAIFADEAHFLKDKKAYRSKAVRKLIKGVPHFVPISGTFLKNGRPIDLFNILNMVRPDLFNNEMKFGKRYCNGKFNGFGWDFTGHSRLDELRGMLYKHLMIRRLKKDVLKDLPPKTRTIVPIELSNPKEYSKAENDFLDWMERKNFNQDMIDRAFRAEALTKINYLSQIAYKGKIEACIDWIKNFLESGEKLVVFGIHRAVIGQLYLEFKEIAVKVDGGTSPNEKQKAIDSFQEDPKVRLFLGNVDAAGVGTTLTAASNEAFIEFPWSPSQLIQAEDRIHRIGQEAEAINIWYLAAEDTIEEDRLALLHNKMKIAERTLDGKFEVEGLEVVEEFLKNTN